MDEVHVGFSGTQDGMTDLQNTKITIGARLLFNAHDSVVAHHGDCIGADAQFHEIMLKVAREFPGKRLRLIGHPCNIEHKRAHCIFDWVNPVKPPLERNHDIVDVSKFMLFTPKEMHEVLRSGTWATIRYCRKRGGPYQIFYPQEINND